MDRKVENEPTDFAQLWEQHADDYGYTNPRRGDIRNGTVIQISPSEIVVDIGSKQDASVSLRELQGLTPAELASIEVGRQLPVYVLRPDRVTGRVLVSIEMAREYADWLRAESLLESGEIVEAEIVGYNKGGLLCSFGRIQGFVPASQILYGNHPGRQGDMASMAGLSLALKVIEVNSNRRRLILSERAAAREWRVQQRERLLEELEVGDVRTGVVSNLCDFGAFVDLGGMDGLVHLSELSWERVTHPKEVVQIGDTVKVQVLNVDAQRQRIGLSIKRTQPDPWQEADVRYDVGMVVRGTVTHLVNFGVFVSLMPGVEGLIHVSELEEDAPDLGSILAEGDEINVLVLGVDAENHRISLSPQLDPADLADDIDSRSAVEAA